MRKKYVPPKIAQNIIPNEVVPLAFFGPAAAAAAVAGVVAGAIAAGKALGKIDNQTRNAFNQEIVGLCA